MRMTASRLVATILTALTALISPALAAAAPAPWARMDVTLIEEGGQTILLVAGELPTSTPLPAEVALPLPKGAVLQWAGELIDPSGQNDIELEPRKREQGDVDVYTMRLTRSHVAQVEGLIGRVTARDGDAMVTALAWTPIADVPEIRISARVPAGARIVNARPEEAARLIPADGMWSYFSRTVENVRANEPVTLTFAYTLGQAGGPAAPRSNGVAIAVIVLAGLVLLGLFGTLIAKKRALASAAAASVGAEEGGALSALAVDAGRSGAETVSITPEPPAAVGDEPGTAPSPARTILVAAVVIAALAIGLFAAARGTSPVAVGDAITQTFGTGEACTTAAFEVEPATADALQGRAGDLMKSLSQVPGVGRVAIIPAQNRIEVGYCDSAATLDDVRAAIVRSGAVKSAREAGKGGPDEGSPGSPANDATAPASE